MNRIETKAPRGTYDILPDSSYRWSYLRDEFVRIAECYGFVKVSTPIFEKTSVFERGVGVTTDIVRKEMYRFKDLGGRDLALRPEGTAGVVRAYIEHKLYGKGLPLKVYYLGPMFRYERPQSGRYRQHQQAGAEIFGCSGSMIDAEAISMLVNYYREIGIKNIQLLINSMGHPDCRELYKVELQDYLRRETGNLCDDCKIRIDLNPLRGFDCKVEGCIEVMKSAPKLIDHICADCRSHLESVEGYLRILGLDFEIDPTLVRGFDYYTRTTFEVRSAKLGAQNAIGGGGRYDLLVEEFGGPPTPALGFAIGIERTLLALDREGSQPPPPKPLDLFLIALGEEAGEKAFRILSDLRQAGISSDMDYLGRSLKSQLKLADKIGVPKVAIIGEDELRENAATVRDMKSGEQKKVPLNELVRLKTTD